MQVTVVIQEHPSGQVNVCFSSDPTVDPLQDLIVQSWVDSKITVGKIILIGEPELIERFCQTEFRSVNNSLDIETSPVINALFINDLLEGTFRK